MSKKVILEPYEIAMAAHVGVARQLQAIAEGRPDVHGRIGEPGWNIHIEGAAGELACAKVLGRYWSGPVGTFKQGGDVGDLQVRTRSGVGPRTELIIRENDRDRDKFVLVVGLIPEFEVVGWIYAGRAKKVQEWKKTHGFRPPAWFVPHHALYDLDQLKLLPISYDIAA